VALRPIEAVDGALVLEPDRHRDHRGELLEWFRADELLAATGRQVPVAQANLSVSRRGVLRGVHVSDVPPGQGKVVVCVDGSVLDAVVDLRVGSPTFGRHEVVVLDDESRRALWVPEGVGHGFLVTSAFATVAYLCTTPYAPERERVVHPLSVGVDWGPDGAAPILSERDAGAPTLDAAVAAGWLPGYEASVSATGR
jgi:dTDP-4-dehydrorhamnose 3,5-epimerase